MVATLETKVESLSFEAYPYPSGGPNEWLSWLNEMMGDVWSDIQEEIDPLLTASIQKFNPNNCPGFDTFRGWGRLDELTHDWEEIGADNLPSAVVLDIESIKYIHLDSVTWLPCLCICYGNDGCWYAWQEQNPMHMWEENQRRTIPFPTGLIIVGQNASAHDSQFLDCEYLPVSDSKCTYIDTRSLAAIIRGVHPSQRAQWEKHKVTLSQGKPVPDWVTEASDLNLEDLTRDLLGIEINKSVNGWHAHNIPAPKTLFEYCAQDVWATLLLFQKLWPLVQKIYAASPIVWWGMGAVTGLRYPVGRWPSLVDGLYSEYEDAKKVKPPLRDDDQKSLVHWGKTHFQDFSEGFDVGGMMAMRINPAKCVSGEWDSTVWSQPGFIRTIMMTGTGDAPDGNGYVPVQVRVPVPDIPSNTLAKTLATQPIIATPLARAPRSISASKKAKADWLQKRPLVDMAYIMIGLLDCFCLEYEIDGFLMVPDQESMWWGVKECDFPLFQKAVTKSQEISLTIMEGWYL
ncbi:MAG: hypothetical protein AAGA46_00155 [Cyanobacteria bacterium P01_F01_bin.13]